MKKIITINLVCVLALTVSAFAQGGWQDVQTKNGSVSLATNIAVTTVPTKIDGPAGNCNVRVLVNSGAAGVTLLMSTATTANATVTNQISGSLGTLQLAPGSTNVFKRGGTFELWTGYFYGQSAAGTTNNVIVLDLKP